MDYSYPLNYDWTIEEITDVIALYTAVEQAYEEGISAEDFMKAYRQFKTIVDSKMEEKQLDEQFKEVSGYSIYQVKKACGENSWVKL